MSVTAAAALMYPAMASDNGIPLWPWIAPAYFTGVLPLLAYITAWQPKPRMRLPPTASQMVSQSAVVHHYIRGLLATSSSGCITHTHMDVEVAGVDSHTCRYRFARLRDLLHSHMAKHGKASCCAASDTYETAVHWHIINSQYASLARIDAPMIYIHLATWPAATIVRVPPAAQQHGTHSIREQGPGCGPGQPGWPGPPGGPGVQPGHLAGVQGPEQQQQADAPGSGQRSGHAGPAGPADVLGWPCQRLEAQVGKGACWLWSMPASGLNTRSHLTTS